ncbi:MAG: L-histidine N(alpha)-methyltransferase [bacterium]|nr:L-histidine N(alpha)-methyltransferase [bacterium]
MTESRPADSSLLKEVLQGLRHEPKSLPCKYFYDERGSHLFEEICALEEYYPTRTEIGIMERHAAEMAAAIGPGSMIIELGSGAGIKIRLLLGELEAPAAYAPVDISRAHLLNAAEQLRADCPELEILPIFADFTHPFLIPAARKPPRRRVVYFPGSTIGNFTPEAAGSFLESMREICGPGGGMLIGVDLKKDRKVLEAAYDDEKGVTREFNLNILRNINREFGADFQADAFEHLSFYNEEEGRIEMHLVSRKAQTVRLGKEKIRLEKDERIHTENSYKYTLDEFGALAAGSGYEVKQVWTDSGRLFSVQYLAAG